MTAEAGKLHGCEIYLDFPSAGATQHLMTAASLAEGVTRIENAALEPEVVDLGNFLIAMGAKVRGHGTGTVEVQGVSELHAVTYPMLADRMEAGTFAIAAAVTQGDVTMRGAVAEHCTPVLQKLQEAGIKVSSGDDWIRIAADRRPLAVDIKTMPHPGFPTDMQQPFAALLAIAEGTSVISENVYERRFKYVAELQRMGADITQEGRTAIIKGVPKLTGAEVQLDRPAGRAPRLSSPVSPPTVAPRSPESSTLDRGYENIVGKLASLGAEIVRMDSEVKPALREA